MRLLGLHFSQLLLKRIRKGKVIMTGYSTISPQCEIGKCNKCLGIVMWVEGKHMHEGECEHTCHKETED